MDVDKLQKINQLANELRKHNFALSNDEAYHQAETVYEEGATVMVQQPVAQTLHIQTQELSSRKFELMLEMNNKKFEAQFETYRNAINTLAEELETLKTELRKGNSAETPKQKEKQVELKTEVKEDHPRQGKFQPADVDIQKMFYFGAKR